MRRHAVPPLLASLLLLPPVAPLAAQAPDLVLLGGKVFTADSTRPWAEAVAVRGARIVAVGTTAEVERLAGPRTRRVALGGRTVIPGINDAHDHVGPRFGVPVVTEPGPEPDPPLAAVLDSVRAAAARTPKGRWLVAYVGMRAVDDTASRLARLDAAAPDHPVMLRVSWGHFLQANTRALRAMGITEASRDPVGGWYGRDAAGRLDGRVQENAAMVHTRRLWATLPPRAFADAYRALGDEALRLGITTVQDMSEGKSGAAAARALREAGTPLRVRVVAWPLRAVPGEAAAWDASPARPTPTSVRSGRKYMLDGTPLERLAAQRAPYADRPGWRGRLNYPPDTVRAILAEALRRREQVMLHAVGDSTIALVLATMRALAPDSAWRPLRVRLEHGDWLTGDLLPTARALGVVLVQNPAHLMLAPGLVAARFGGAQPGFQPLRSTLAAGVPLAFGSDGPRNPFLNVMFATMHANNPAEALTREQAVVAYTRTAAWAEHAEREKGTLAPGMLADLAVLSQDVFTVPPQALPGTTSVLTLVGGRVAWDAKVLGAR
ncbi:amidohydrolase [Roseisolibacter sp. H3M3-2]|uniref:amidohydrolase n=1 Tax=Roseisolibacter sp. H3M3-2 TaxID=3031323 RepID=UPI0023DBBC6F|nr:amidohydrolase [Roseisolibacter sp. H3M3-2]MDF1503816.1 amidohydrolase [Roseisolibacter sp. H3M3-2]